MATNCSREVLSRTSMEVGYAYVMTFITLLGIFTNIMNILILSRRFFKGSPFSYMYGLSYVDLVSCSLALPMALIRGISNDDQEPVRMFYRNFIYVPVVNTFATCSVWTTVAMSLERLIVISNPMLTVKQITPYAVIVCLLMAAILMNLPFFFRKHIDVYGKIVPTAFSESSGYLVFIWFRTILVKIVPLLTVAIINVLLICVLVKATRKHKTLVQAKCQINQRGQNSERSQTSVTIVLISVCAIYLVCHVLEPITHPTLFRTLFGECSTYTKPYHIIVMVANILEIFSYATNFFPYCIVNRLFRRCVVLLLKCRSLNSVQDMSAREHSKACDYAVERRTSTHPRIHKMSESTS